MYIKILTIGIFDKTADTITNVTKIGLVLHANNELSMLEILQRSTQLVIKINYI